MKKFVSEFKEFALKGNVIDLAVGVIIGAAFKAIVDSLVNDIVMPLIGLITGGMNFNEKTFQVGEATVAYGNFISAILNFFIMAIVIFCFVKAINKAKNAVKKPAEEAAPTTKKCPFCKSDIDIEATKCPNCTSDIPEEIEE